jgi:hypothetical protein
MSGVGLDTAFNQDEPQQNINTHAKQDKQAEGLEDERKDKKKLNLERIQHAKVGETVSYNATTGTIVRKDGSYVTIYNEGNNAFDQVHAGTTSISTDTIGSGITGQLWDQMRQEQRVASLSKAGVQEPLHFISRKWSELPMNLKDVLKVNPTSRGEPGEKMPGTASNTSERTTITPAGRNIQTGQQGTKLNTGQERTFTPGGKKPEKKVVKEPSAAAQARAHSTGATNERARGQDIMSRGAQSGLDILTAKKPKDEGVTFASCKSTEYISKLSPSSTSVGSGYKGKVPEGASIDKPSQPRYGTTTGQTKGPGQTASTTDKITNKKPSGVKPNTTNPKKEKPAPKASLLASHEAGKQEQHTRNHEAITGAAQSGLGIMTSKKPKDDGVTFASGIEKSNTYGDLATALYRIRNNLNKLAPLKSPRASTERPNETRAFQSETEDLIDRDTMTQNKPTSERSGAKDPVSKVQSSTPSGPGFGKIEGTGGKSPSTPAAGGIKYFSDSGKGPFGSQKEADESAPRKQRNISAERTARSEYNAKPGQTVANRLSEVKQSDPEHGAYGGVVTDTPFDAPEDYEEDREDVHGKEFDHNHQQKTPKDFCVPQAKDTKKEGAAVSTGATTTGTPGAYNPKYDPDEDGYKEKAIVNKSNTRYGPRQVTKEEADAYLNK